MEILKLKLHNNALELVQKKEKKRDKNEQYKRIELQIHIPKVL